MSKSGVIVLIIAAIVFAGLGFVIGNVVSAAGTNPGSIDDPVMTQQGVEKLISARIADLEGRLDSMEALLDATVSGEGGTNVEGNTESGNVTDAEGGMHVKVTADSVNVRASASTSSQIVSTISSGTELEYLDSTAASDGTWYQVRLQNGSIGYVAGWLCSDPY
ncbi:MAG: SH3 domain-containing protein [Bacillota bacterium]|nr:SH3 domain-containing protein [Bacillota bacterium]